jgi:hypothetical protein
MSDEIQNPEEESIAPDSADAAAPLAADDAPASDASSDADNADNGAEAAALAPVTRPESTIRTAVKEQDSTGAIVRNIPKVEVPDTPLRLAPGFKEDHDLHLQEPGTEGNVMLWGFLVIIGGGVVVVLIYIMQIIAILPGLTESKLLREESKGDG